MTAVREQAVTGVTPPQTAEAVIRVVWPSVAAVPGVARLGQKLQRTILLAPLGWLLLAPFYFKKILPVVGRRYTLTNRRLMIQAGWSRKPLEELSLDRIEDVRLEAGSENAFYRTANLEVLSEGKVALRLPGVPGAEAFRRVILNASRAWAPARNGAPKPSPAPVATSA